MKIELDQLTGKLILQFGYRKELVEAIKSLPDRRYKPESKEWVVGFDESILNEILAMLAGNNFPPEQLNQAEIDCKAYLSQNPALQLSENEYQAQIKPPLVKLGELVLDAYTGGKITQAEQVSMLSILNHLSIKDFIK